MARKTQVKIIRQKPKSYLWKPEDINNSNLEVILLLEEWECVRLIDYNGLSQQEAAISMEVSRQTVQKLIQSARKKISRCIVESIPLKIDGGNYLKDLNLERTSKMIVAVTFENEKVFSHFGRTPYFKIYEIENGEILREEVLATPEAGHGALAGFLVENKVNTLICGGIGGGAVNALSEAGIEIYSGASGDVTEQVKSFISGQLPVQGKANCNHKHEHHHGEGGCHGDGKGHGHHHGEGGCHGEGKGHHKHGKCS